MRVNVTHGIGDLANDLAAVPEKLKAQAPAIVKKDVRAGRNLARRYARAKSGPHGKSYYKRITDEMTGPLEGEYGPHDGGTPVGGGWRNGPPNTDLPRSADVIGPKFADDISDLVDGLFW